MVHFSKDSPRRASAEVTNKVIRGSSRAARTTDGQDMAKAISEVYLHNLVLLFIRIS